MTEDAARASVPPLSVGEAAASPGPRPMLVLLAVLTTVAVAYAGVLDAPLLWDDVPLLEHPSVAKLHPWLDYLLSPFWDLSRDGRPETLFYRPLTILSLALDAAWHGRNPTGFHVTNLILHLANVSCVFFLARRVGASTLAAGAGALVWGLLPRLAEAVSWISGRTDELGALGVLGALLVWRRGSLARVSLASAFALAGMLGKEMGVAAPLALAVGELWPRPTRRGWLRALVPLTVLVGYLTLRTAVVGQVTGPGFVDLTVGERILTGMESLGRYSWMTLDVWHPATQIGVVGRPDMRFVVVGGVALLGGAWLARRCARRLDGTCAALTVAGLLPLLLVMHVVPLPWLAVVGDRLMYLPWAILAIGVAVGCSRYKLEGAYRHGVAAAVVGLVLSLILATRARVAVFADEVEFWIDAVETTPAANWWPTVFLNELYVRAGLYQESLDMLLSFEGREPQPVPLDTPGFLARALGRLGRYEEAYALRRSDTLAREGPEDILDEAIAALHVFDLKRADELATEAHRALPQYERAARIQKTVAEVSRLRQLLRGALPPGLDGEIARARLSTLAGRGPEAEEAWSALLSRPDLPTEVAEEGFAFLAELGSHDELKRALALYQARGDARGELVLAARERLSFGTHLAREWPRVVRALERLRGPGRSTSDASDASAKGKRHSG